MRKTLLLLLLTAVFCGAFARKTPQVAPAPQVPDSLRGFYLFTEGIKQAFIERDTAAARASLERSVEADSTYGPAWYELAELLLLRRPALCTPLAAAWFPALCSTESYPVFLRNGSKMPAW